MTPQGIRSPRSISELCTVSNGIRRHEEKKQYITNRAYRGSSLYCIVISFASRIWPSPLPVAASPLPVAAPLNTLASRIWSSPLPGAAPPIPWCSAFACLRCPSPPVVARRRIFQYPGGPHMPVAVARRRTYQYLGVAYLHVAVHRRRVAAAPRRPVFILYTWSLHSNFISNLLYPSCVQPALSWRGHCRQREAMLQSTRVMRLTTNGFILRNYSKKLVQRKEGMWPQRRAWTECSKKLLPTRPPKIQSLLQELNTLGDYPRSYKQPQNKEERDSNSLAMKLTQARSSFTPAVQKYLGAMQAANAATEHAQEAEASISLLQELNTLGHYPRRYTQQQKKKERDSNNFA